MPLSMRRCSLPTGKTVVLTIDLGALANASIIAQKHRSFCCYDSRPVSGKRAGDAQRNYKRVAA